jgi:hypothetical protein
MDINKIHEIVQDAENKSNKDLYAVEDILAQEFEKTKDLLIELTRHLDSVRSMHEIVSNEIFKRSKKI